jgi:hypothetical protein
MHAGTPSHSCPFQQPSCASRWSAPDGLERLARPYDDPEWGHFLRAEGYSRRCYQFKSVTAQRHLSPRRPAACEIKSNLSGPSGHLSYEERLKAPFVGELAALLTERLLLHAEGFLKRRCQFEFITAQRHLSPRRLRPAKSRAISPAPWATSPIRRG